MPRTVVWCTCCRWNGTNVSLISMQNGLSLLLYLYSTTQAYTVFHIRMTTDFALGLISFRTYKVAASHWFCFSWLMLNLFWVFWWYGELLKFFLKSKMWLFYTKNGRAVSSEASVAIMILVANSGTQCVIDKHCLIMGSTDNLNDCYWYFKLHLKNLFWSNLCTNDYASDESLSFSS